MNGGSINTDVTYRDPIPTSGGAKRFRPGDEILGRYVVEAELGQGGMGVVYLCLDKVAGVKVAVKGLPPEVSHNADEMEEIRSNFQLVNDLRHSSIAGIRTLEKDGRGDYYLVMDVARGVNLNRWMRANRDATLERKLAVLAEVASALDYAHSRKVMHRDIKPENVMIDEEDHVQILDFGLAARIRTSMSRVSMITRSMSGTPTYKSPEQWRGHPQNAAADQYSLGVMAYEMISGYLPFDNDDVEMLRMAVLNEEVQAVQDVPAHVNAALARALAKNPGERFATCGDFVTALAGGKVSAKKSSAAAFKSAAEAGRSSAFGMKRLVLLVAGVLVVAALAVVFLRGGTDRDGSGREGISRAGIDRDGNDNVSTIRSPVKAPTTDEVLEAFRNDHWRDGYKLAQRTDQKHPKIQCYIGMCYDQKESASASSGVTKDDWTARTWYQKSADQGDSRAMMKLGMFCENGRAGEKDLDAALAWYEKAADAGNSGGKANLQRLKAKLRRAAESAAVAAELEKKQKQGYVIEGEGGDARAVWRPGQRKDDCPHWITGEAEGEWTVEDGYAMVSPDDGVFSALRWQPGWHRPGVTDKKAGEVEGTWMVRQVCGECRGSGKIKGESECSICEGTGRVEGSVRCATCSGSGQRTATYRCNVCNGNNVTTACRQCGGRGVGRCASCNGTGRVANVIGGLIGLFGKRKRPVGPTYVNCMSCGGNGRVTCSACDGNGRVQGTCSACRGSGQFTRNVTCSACGGSGSKSTTGACSHCTRGRVTTKSTCAACENGYVWRFETGR